MHNLESLSAEAVLRAKSGCPNCKKNMQAVAEHAVSDKWIEKEALR
jgi:hypothetical protein